MLSDFRAHSHIRGERIDLSWIWDGPDPRPKLRLVRQRRAYPADVSDGVTVIDLDDDFSGVDDSTIGVEREFYLPVNTVVESSLPMAELELYFDNIARPYRARIAYYRISYEDDTATEEYLETGISDVSRVAETESHPAPWKRVLTREIFVTPGGGGPEVSAGRVIVCTGHEDGVTRDRFEWVAEGVTPVNVDFVHYRRQNVTVVLKERFNPDSGGYHRAITVHDDALDSLAVYYYALFEATDSNVTPYRTQRNWRASGMATGRYGLGDQLYRLLPSLHQYYDEPDTSCRGKGELRRFLGVFGSAADQFRSLAEGLTKRHNVHEVQANALPTLARWIGWEPDLTADALTLRSDIRQAPEIFRTVGTVPNLRAVVNRVTGWDCKIKEFAHNVFLANAPESILLWELWARTYDEDTAEWSVPESLTRTAGFDGSASRVHHGGIPWLIWHSDRAGTRDLWLKQYDVEVAAPYRTVTDPRIEGRLSPPINEYPSAVVDSEEKLWLIWNSNRNGQWDVWAAWDVWNEGQSGWSVDDRPFLDAPKGAPVNLSDHGAEDRHPAAVVDGNKIWLFWQSDRRGPTDIWARVYDGSLWGPVQRVTTAQFRHESPTAVNDGDGRIWLFYIDDRGDRSNLVLRVHEGNVWSPPVVATDGPWRDEAPAVVLYNGRVWLFWHCNREGPWQVLGQAWKWDDQAQPQGIPVPVSELPFALTSETTGDKEPTPFVDGDGNLRVIWRSQRRGRANQSRSIDTNDPEMLAQLGTYEDRAHYSYDTATTDTDWYARNTVGIYLTPNTEQPDAIERSRRLIEGPLREFIPIHVRPVLFIQPTVYEEYVYTYEFSQVEPQRTIGEFFEREAEIVSLETYDGMIDSYTDYVPAWTWLRAWSENFTDHHAVDFDQVPIESNFRTWHIEIKSGD